MSDRTWGIVFAPATRSAIPVQKVPIVDEDVIVILKKHKK